MCALLFVTCELRARRHVRLEITIRNRLLESSVSTRLVTIYICASPPGGARVTVAPRGSADGFRAFPVPGRDLTRFRAPAMAPARRAVGSGCLERARHRRSLPRRQYRIAVDRGGRPGPPRSLRREIHARDLYRDNGPQHSQSENRTSHDLSCLVLATSHSHAHVSRANTTARRESPQPMPRGSSMPRTESARVHMQGAGRVRRCSLVAPRAPLILT